MPRVFAGEENQSSNWQKTPFITPGDTPIGTEKRKKESLGPSGKFKLIQLVGNLEFPTVNLFTA